MASAQVAPAAVKDSVTAKPTSILFKKERNAGSIKPFVFPAVLITYGLVSLGNNPIRDLDYSTRAELQEDHPLFANHADDYLRLVPIAAVYGLNLAGIKGKHSVTDQTGIYFLSMAMMAVSTTAVKNTAGRSRPDGGDNYSFPSGHTAMAFVAAEVLNQEYRDVSPWIGYAGYTVATATGVLRMYNNRHWLSDVVAGAGFGLASAKVAYLLYPGLKRLLKTKPVNQYTIAPTYQQKAFGIAFHSTF